MFILINGKLYIRMEDKLVGVSITPTETILHENEVREMPKSGYKALSKREVLRKFNIVYGLEYNFPTEDVVENAETSENIEPEQEIFEMPKMPEHVGAGWYELPNGERVRGKEKALEAFEAYLRG